MNSLSQVLRHYKSTHQALPAFNIDTFEIFQAVLLAVKETKLPCIVQLSKGEDQYFTAENLFILTKKAQIEGHPIYLNMDHGKDISRLLSTVKLGFDMVHFDGSSLEYQDNLSQATDFVRQAKLINPNIVVEVEFNKISLVNSYLDPNSFTNPTQAKEFLTTTNADLLAVSIGNMHGVNTDSPEKINLELLSQIYQNLPEDKFLTLHGGSGIPLPSVQQSLQYGITKININTDLRLQFKHSLADVLSHLSSEKIYEYMIPIISDISQVVKQKLLSFSSATSNA